MTNAFTAKPDVSGFIKKVKHSANASAIGQRAAANPSPEQRYFFSDNRPHGTYPSGQKGGQGQPVETDGTPVHGTAPSVRTRNRKAGGVRD